MQLARALIVVAVLAAWNAYSGVLAERLELRGLPIRLLDLTVYLGLIVGVGCVWLGKRSLGELGWRLSGIPRLLGYGVLQTALLVGLVFLVYAALGGLASVRGLASAIATIPLSERVIYLIAGAKVAFVEETVFRGDLLGRLSERTSVCVSVALSSLVFALYHRTFAAVPLGMKVVLGVIFALFTLRTRSLVPSALGHWWLWVIVGDN
jgi:membrane protease YdiL (CAAX protease family)